MPMKNWLNGEWNPLMHELLSASNLAEEGDLRRTVHRRDDASARSRYSEPQPHALGPDGVSPVARSLCAAGCRARHGGGMHRDLKRMASMEHDVVVVGGGIHGACAAWEAVRRGLRVALVDAGDFGNATSSNSLRTFHGGLALPAAARLQADARIDPRATRVAADRPRDREADALHSADVRLWIARPGCDGGGAASLTTS